MNFLNKIIVLLSSFLLLTGCKDEEMERLKYFRELSSSQIKTLKSDLDNNKLRNAQILKTYATTLKKEKPELSELVSNLESDTSSKGDTFIGLEEKLKKVSKEPSSDQEKLHLLADAESLANESNKDIYNDSLIDVINTLASMSGGTLNEIGTPSNAQGDKTAGSNLIGNPRYGQWTTRNGSSFWEWYGKYALFKAVFFPNPYGYSMWSYNRPWSYYGSYGRNSYSTFNQRNTASTVQKTNAKSVKDYGRKTGRNVSSYSNMSNTKFKPSSSSVSAKSRGLSSSRTRSSSYGSSVRKSSRSSGMFRGK